MIFAKVDVELRDHIKAKRAGGAMSTWTWGLLYARGQETDGVVHREAIGGSWAGEAQGLSDAARLVEVGLWLAVDEGWEIANFLKKNESKAAIEARKETDRLRKTPSPKRKRKRAPRGIQTDSDRNPNEPALGIPGSGSGSGSGLSGSRSEEPTGRTDHAPPPPPSRPHNDGQGEAPQPVRLIDGAPRFSSGTGGATVDGRSVFESAVANATGRPFSLARAPYHDRDLISVLNTHPPAGTSAFDAIHRWLPSTIAEWLQARGDAPTAIEPSKLLDWLNGGRREASYVRGKRGPGGGPKGDRQGLDGWTPPKRTGTDAIHPFGGDE